MTKPALTTLRELTPIFIQQYERYLPSAFDESMTILQKMNKVINTLQEVYEISSELISKWNEVMEWIMNEGLEDTVLAQLQKWLDDGTLENLINDDLFGALNDATFSSPYYHNIKIEKLYDDVTKTEYRIFTIPQYDEKGNKLLWKRGYAKDSMNSGQTETATEFAARHNASVVVNASVFDTTTYKLKGLQINNGVVINDEYPDQRIDRQILVIKDDGTFGYYPANTPSANILADGVKNALTGFITLISNGVALPDNVLKQYDAWDWKYRRQVIGKLANGDYIILSTQSDTYGDVGFDVFDCTRVLLARGVQFAFMLDGGGSMQTVIRGLNHIPPKDVAGTQDRPVPDFLYIAKPIVTDRDKDLRDANGDIGLLKPMIEKNRSDIYTKTDMLNGYMRLKTGNADYTSHGIEIWAGDVKQAKLYITKDFLSYYDYLHDPNGTGGTTVFKVTSDGQLTVMGQDISGATAKLSTNINTEVNGGKYWITPSATGNPNGANSFAVDYYKLDTGSGLQIAHSFATPSVTFKRIKRDGVWEAWG